MVDGDLSWTRFGRVRRNSCSSFKPHHLFDASNLLQWNGFGGKIDPGETIKQAALREMHEESGLEVLDARYAGRNIFEFVGEPLLLEVHIFKATLFNGKLLETEEMLPKWFDIADIPYDEMWKDDREWLPLLLEDQNFENYFLFKGHDEIVERDIELLKPGEAFTRSEEDRLVEKLQESIKLDLGLTTSLGGELG